MFAGKSVGVWGFGAVGKAATRWCLDQGITPTVMDKQDPTPDDAAWLASHAIPFSSQKNAAAFLAAHDYIIPSPGIDLRPYAEYQDKFIAEIDIFCTLWKKPIIAITGTIGKTSVTYLLSELLIRSGHRVATGGNIGTGMLALLPEQPEKECAILELSSFQLEYSRACKPTVGIITNIYPNHLDRHGSLEEYTRAKLALIAQQNSDTVAIIPVDLLPVIRIHPKLKDRRLTCISYEPMDPQSLSHFGSERIITRTVAGDIVILEHGTTRILVPSAKIPQASYPANWIIIAAAIDALGYSPSDVFAHAGEITLPHHRLAPVATINGITFYNDSKATIMPAVIAAVDKLSDTRVILLLGGLSKGVNRAPYMRLLAPKVARIVCFGAEAYDLARMCTGAKIEATYHATLEAALQDAYMHASAGDAIVLSPGGSSFDLFADYTQRGARFIELVQELATHCAK